MSRRGGFTLIEVLVALAISAIGLAAVLSVVSETSRNASYLHDRTFANWIALNRLTELRIAGVLPPTTRSDGEVEFANDKWKWTQAVTETGVPGMLRVDITVRHASDRDDATIATLTGFVGRTQETGSPSSMTWELPPAQAPGGNGKPGQPGQPGNNGQTPPGGQPGVPQLPPGAAVPGGVPAPPPATTTTLDSNGDVGAGSNTDPNTTTDPEP